MDSLGGVLRVIPSTPQLVGTSSAMSDVITAVDCGMSHILFVIICDIEIFIMVTISKEENIMVLWTFLTCIIRFKSSCSCSRPIVLNYQQIEKDGNTDDFFA